MANNFHDIIPPERRSIRNITTTHRHPRRGRRSAEEVEQEHEAHNPPPPPPEENEFDDRPSFFSRFGLWILALAVVVVFVLVFSLLFSGTKVTVTPKERDVFIDGQFEAYRTASVGQLAYEVMSIEKESSESVPATGEAEVEERASGKIIIFNDFDDQPQRLITNTRFETPEGLIYRIDKPVIVPGQQEVDGETVPGSIEVTVYANDPGEQYNIGLTDFTIPGFEGSPRFEGFYARSRTPMAGGFSGTRLTANEDDITRARTALREQVEQELREQVYTEIPDGFHLFDGAIFVTFESLPQSGEGNSVVLNEKGTLHGLLYRADDLARFVAANTVAGYEQEPVHIDDFSNLDYALEESDVLQPWDEEHIAFSLTGNINLVWVYDADALKEDLAGRSKEALPTILSGYPSIQEAEVSLRPFWRRTFPENTEKISIESNGE